jgi:excisionase family DNA binding protein
MSGSKDPDILNIEEAAALLGVSVKTFNKVLHTQRLPARKIGREWKFSRRHLIDWVGSGRSDEFYRDAAGADDERAGPRDEQGALERPVEEDGAPAAATAAQGERRRTSGWRLELD